MNQGWIGVDLDGTLAHYTGWIEESHIGSPIEPMAARVRHWITQGKNIRIVTARVAACQRVNPGGVVDDQSFANRQRAIIEKWCLTHLGSTLPVTASKDMDMLELWDDRAIQVILNTGIRADGQP